MLKQWGFSVSYTESSDYTKEKFLQIKCSSSSLKQPL